MRNGGKAAAWSFSRRDNFPPDFVADSRFSLPTLLSLSKRTWRGFLLFSSYLLISLRSVTSSPTASHARSLCLRLPTTQRRVPLVFPKKEAPPVCTFPPPLARPLFFSRRRRRCNPHIMPSLNLAGRKKAAFFLLRSTSHFLTTEAPPAWQKTLPPLSAFFAKPPLLTQRLLSCSSLCFRHKSAWPLTEEAEDATGASPSSSSSSPSSSICCLVHIFAHRATVLL